MSKATNNYKRVDLALKIDAHFHINLDLCQIPCKKYHSTSSPDLYLKLHNSAHLHNYSAGQLPRIYQIHFLLQIIINR